MSDKKEVVIMRLHGINFPVETVKDNYTSTSFIKAYKGVLGDSAEAAYYTITGKKAPESGK